MRVASYNIWNGGKGRIKEIAEVLKGMDADVVGLLEAVGWADEGDTTLKDLAGMLGYTFHAVAKANSKYNVAVMARMPLEVEAINENVRHVVLHARPKEGPHRESHFFFLHLSPVDEDDRLRELGTLIPAAQKYDHAFLLGDFNSLSPHDPYDRGKLVRVFKKENIKKYGVDELRFDVVKHLESQLWTDAMRHTGHPFVPTVPTELNEDPHHAIDLRIDYAFTSPEATKKMRLVTVIQNDTTEKASDHYPIFVEVGD